jgi:hypothetical protein
MKTAIKLAAAGIALSVSAWASAVPVLTISGQGSVAATAAEAAFLATLGGSQITETFDTAGYTPGAQSLIINSAAGVGSFTSVSQGSGGACDNGSYNCSDGLAVLDAGTTPFNGRFSVSPDNWLDSMDATEMKISPTAGYNAMGFFMTDPNDSGGRFDIGGVGFSFADVFGSALGNGKMFYITLSDTAGLGDVSIFSNAQGDGYGLDNVTIGSVSVPEPGTLALFAPGLMGLGIARKSARS